jgi:glycerophosphoryl diester phosphodiesterase
MRLRQLQPVEPLAPATRPVVIAHRGASYDFAEHTRPAYLAAIEAGADGLEADVRLTRDGHLVCIHDRTVSRTTDGDGAVSRYHLEELKELEFAEWHQRNPMRGVRILELRELFEIVKATPRPVRLFLETKHPNRYAGLIEKTLVDVLAEYGWAGDAREPYHPDQPANHDLPVTVMSFNAVALRRVKLLAPDVPSVQLIDHWIMHRPNGVLPAGIPAAGPALRLLRQRPHYVERAHDRGVKVYVWTVDKPEDVEFVRSLGVDGIITNRPLDVIEQLNEANSPTA